MWPQTYEDRLASWCQLRETNQTNNLEVALLAVNDWWQAAPLSNHYLHWDDCRNWPDPWDLLADNIYCSLAKALGIVYTLHLIDRSDIDNMQLAQSQDGNDNLVLINKGLYILNWAWGEMLNISSEQVDIKRVLEAQVVTKNIH